MVRGIFIVLSISLLLQLAISSISPSNVAIEAGERCMDTVTIVAEMPSDEWIPDSAYIHDLNARYSNSLKNTTVRTDAYRQQYQSVSDSQKPAIIQSTTNHLFHSLIDSAAVFDLWMGTAWDFNGITERPLDGEIACGYFVSTTLKHVGFNLNRYKLAQQYSHSIVKSLCAANTIKTYNSLEELIEKIDSKRNQLYIVGLDSHVGFLANVNGKSYFIHSDYITSRVVKELATESPALSYSQRYVLGNLTGENPELIKKWLDKEAITIIP